MKSLAVKFSLGLFVLTLGLSGLTSCNKYEEGPQFSFLPAKNRLARTWRLTDVTKNGNSFMNSNYTLDVTFGKNGSVNGKEVTSVNGSSITNSYVGNWEFNGDKTHLLVKKDGENDFRDNEILELRNSDLKLRYTDGDDVYVQTYIAN